MNKEERFKVLLYIINKLHKKMNRSGETHIQKLVYLMIMKNKIQFNYDYILYDYGPWSFDLMDDLKFLENAHLVKKFPDPSGFGFKYIPNEDMNFVKDINKTVRDEIPWSHKIDEVINDYKGTHAKRLALLATFIYVCHKHPKKNKAEVIELVKKIKPLHNDFEYDNTYDECKQLMGET